MPADNTDRFVMSAVFVLIVGAWIATGPDALTAQGKKKPTTSNAVMTVEFRDAGSDGVVSDGGGQYVHGASSVEALVYAESGDLRLDLTASARFMTVHLGEPLNNPDAPTNVSYVSQQTLYVQSIGTVQVGSVERRRARVGLSPGLPGYAVGFRYQTSAGVVIEGTELCVHRETVDTWHISSSSTCSGEGDVAGLFQDNLKGKVNHRAVATYWVPFALTATCTANCPQ